MKLVMMAVMVLGLGFGGYTAVEPNNPIISQAKGIMAEYQMKAIGRHVQAQSAGKGRTPSSRDFSGFLKETMGTESSVLDPWSNEYRFDRKGNTAWIRSNGPDGKMGTEDDLEVPFDI